MQRNYINLLLWILIDKLLIYATFLYIHRMYSIIYFSQINASISCQREKRIAAWLYHKTEGKKISFQQGTPSLFLSPYRREDSEEGNALKYLFPLILTHRDFSSFGQKIVFSHPRKKHRELVSSTLYFCSRDASPLQDPASVSLLFPSTLLPLFTLLIVESKCMRTLVFQM